MFLFVLLLKSAETQCATYTFTLKNKTTIQGLADFGSATVYTTPTVSDV